MIINKRKIILRYIFIAFIIGFVIFNFILVLIGYGKNSGFSLLYKTEFLLVIFGIGSFFTNLSILKFLKHGSAKISPEVFPYNKEMEAFVFNVINITYFVWGLLFVLLGMGVIMDVINDFTTFEITISVFMQYFALNVLCIHFGFLMIYDSMFYRHFNVARRTKKNISNVKRNILLKISVFYVFIAIILFSFIFLRPFNKVIISRYSNGIAKEIRNYNNESDTTTYSLRRFYENGSTEMKCKIRNGIIDGFVDTYYLNGERKMSYKIDETYDSTCFFPQEMKIIYRNNSLYRVIALRNSDTTGFVEFDNNFEIIDSLSRSGLRDARLLEIFYGNNSDD